jgi:hypothetical protein
VTGHPRSHSHKLEACVSRLRFQLRKATEFVKTVGVAVPPQDDDPLRQYLYQSTIVMIHSYFEEYLRCIVATATFWKTPAVRQHLAQGLPNADEFVAMPLPAVTMHAQARVAFGNRAEQLKALFQVLIGGSPFADSDAEAKYLDFVDVRNMVVHCGGWPSETHSHTINTPGVIVTTREIEASKFYQLRVSHDFFTDGMVALARSVESVERRVANDPILKLD